MRWPCDRRFATPNLDRKVEKRDDDRKRTDEFR
jgi:hypothetical protein